MGECLAHSRHPQMLCCVVAPNLQAEKWTKCKNLNLFVQLLVKKKQVWTENKDEGNVMIVRW